MKCIRDPTGQMASQRSLYRDLTRALVDDNEMDLNMTEYKAQACQNYCPIPITNDDELV